MFGFLSICDIFDRGGSQRPLKMNIILMAWEALDEKVPSNLPLQKDLDFSADSSNISDFCREMKQSYAQGMERPPWCRKLNNKGLKI